MRIFLSNFFASNFLTGHCCILPPQTFFHICFSPHWKVSAQFTRFFQPPENVVMFATAFQGGNQDGVPVGTTSTKEKFEQEHIVEWKGSSLSQHVYCHQNIFGVAIFGYWQHKPKL
jgi:hypothetical protein